MSPSSQRRSQPDPKANRAPRSRLKRDRVLDAAVSLADAEGADAVSMRRLAQLLGVEAMSLYNHVKSKEDLQQGMLDRVIEELLEDVAEQPLPTKSEQWAEAIKVRSLIARQVMLRHRWAPLKLQEQATISIPFARYFDGVTAILLAGGFSTDLAHHALHALGSLAFGFNQELFKAAPDANNEVDASAMAEHIPHLTRMLAEVADHDPNSTLGWCDNQAEFEFTIDVVIAGLEQQRRISPRLPSTNVP